MRGWSGPPIPSSLPSRCGPRTCSRARSLHVALRLPSQRPSLFIRTPVTPSFCLEKPNFVPACMPMEETTRQTLRSVKRLGMKLRRCWGSFPDSAALPPDPVPAFDRPFRVGPNIMTGEAQTFRRAHTWFGHAVTERPRRDLRDLLPCSTTAQLDAGLTLQKYPYIPMT